MKFCYKYKTYTACLGGQQARRGDIDKSMEMVNSLFQKIDSSYFEKLSSFGEDGFMTRWLVLQKGFKE